MMRATSARALVRVKIWRGVCRYLGGNLVVLEALVPLQDDAVDDRVFLDRDDQIAAIRAGNRDVGE